MKPDTNCSRTSTGSDTRSGPRPMSTDAQRRPHSRAVVRRRCDEGGYTLAEVLAALLFMAILIPVTMHGVSVSSRAGVLGQRKATAMRIAERVLDESIIT